MSESGSTGADVLEGGGPDRPRRRSAGSTGAPGGVLGWFDRHRRSVGWLAVGLAVVAWLGVRWYGDRPPPTPQVQVSQDRSAESEPLWSPGLDGRPGSPVTLSVATQLSVPYLRPGDPQVSPVGLAGPGISSPGVFPHRALGRTPADFDLTGQVACDRVPIPLPATAYQVQLELREPSRTTRATVPLQAAQGAVDRRVTYACSTWLAARDLTVNNVAATVDPLRNHVDLTLIVANRGARDGLVWMGDLSGTGIRSSAVQRGIPAHSTVAIALSVDMDRCPSWSQTGPPLTTTDTPVPLLAGMGIARPLPADQVPLAQGPTGVVLAPTAALQLQGAMVQACGGVASPVLLTDPRTTRYDVRTRVLTTKVLVDLPPGVVASVKFVAAREAGSGIVPLFTSSPWLVPDHSGQAGWTGRFTVPPDVICLGGGPFVTMNAVLRVPTGDGRLRAVSFQLYAETLLSNSELEDACSRG